MTQLGLGFYKTVIVGNEIHGSMMDGKTNKENEIMCSLYGETKASTYHNIPVYGS